MASYTVTVNQIALDSDFYAWGSGQDLRRFNGDSWEYYNYQNSAVPDGSPYFLDTRCISIDNEDKAWVGCAQGPTSGLNEVAIFYIETNNPKEGKSWNFSDLGTFNTPQEISEIYTCPFGDDILAFCTPLNGVGGTGNFQYTEIEGATGGRLFYYLKETDEWREKVPGYIWPHVYDIKAKGIDGKNYLYYIGTSEGLFVLPSGTNNYVDLQDGVGEIIEESEVFNKKTSLIYGDKVYSIDFDEDGNLWIGTNNGISFYDGVSFYNPSVSGIIGKITKVKCRPNGYVFYSKGDGEINEGTGLWCFNGSTTRQFTTSNSDIPNNNVLDIDIVSHNTKLGSTLIYKDSLYVLCLNDFAVFNYDMPHVYGSSNYAGATGWNFTYYETSGYPLPKVNKYTWEYPDWRTYQEKYVVDKFPGTDPRNLFLTTKLSDITSGKAGKQEYWNNWPLEKYEENVIVWSIPQPDWKSGITYTYTNGVGVNGFLQINDSTTLETTSGTKYYICGYMSGAITVNFGKSTYNTNAYLTNSNPTIGGLSYAGIPDFNSCDNGSMGFIVCYNFDGFVESMLPFRGYNTYVDSIVPSDDGNYIFASGTYSKFIESGNFVYDSYENMTPIFSNGPTGAPCGITNPNFSGTTADYPWIFGSTGPILSSSWGWDNTFGSVSGFFDIGYYDDYYFDQVNALYVNYVDDSSVDTSGLMDTVLTGNSVLLYLNPSEYSYYRVDSITTLSGANGFQFNLTWMSGPTGYFGGSFSTGSNFTISFLESYQNSFPIVKNLNARIANDLDYGTLGVFVSKIGKDLGDTNSLSPVAEYETYNGQQSITIEESARKRFRGVSFRHFPQGTESGGSEKKTLIDSTKYSLNLAVTSLDTLVALFNWGNKVATLKNAWNRSDDYVTTDDYILGSSDSILFNWSSDSNISYVKMSSDNLQLLSTQTSSSYSEDFSGQPKKIFSTKSLKSDLTTIITGKSVKGFDFGGIGITGPAGAFEFFIIMDSSGTGATGAYLKSTTTTGTSSTIATKDSSSYYISSVLGGTGDYYGYSFEPGKSGLFVVTGQITEQGVSKRFFYNDITGTSAINNTNLLKSFVLDDKFIVLFKYFTIGRQVNNKGYFYKSRISSGYITDIENFGNAYLQSLTGSTDSAGNLIISGFNNSINAGGGYYTIGPLRGFYLLAPQYKPDLGINLGNIISRPGSGAWTWCDVHNTDKGMEIPLLSTVVFNNYASNLYGKKNNKWILSESNTGEEILNIKNSPYFIYTFTKPGNYTIYNSVEDSAGNVYIATKPGYIRVINHKDKKPEDKNPDYVDSFDYGVPVPFPGRDYQVDKLTRDLEKQQQEYFIKQQDPFGVELLLPFNPDATFREEDI
jgi:hypothetical protein